MGSVGDVGVFGSRWVQLGVSLQMPNEDAMHLSSDSRHKLEVKGILSIATNLYESYEDF
jgi:hypothetical protein